MKNSSAEDLSWNVWFFFIAQLLHGAGAAPLFTLGVTYIDENVSKKMSSVYLGNVHNTHKCIEISFVHFLLIAFSKSD